jgi:SAM-dependent methyltransferase
MSDFPVDWKKDSRSFDRVAGLYDAYRPRYPQELVEHILVATHFPPQGRILEIGSGTGIATLPFAERGYSILCLEPGENLAELARQKLSQYPRVRFSLTAFEDWQPGAELFDLAISAQAFHWTDPETRFQKTASVLHKGGHLALFWNHNLPFPEPLDQELEQVYRQFAPELTGDPPPGYQAGIEYWRKELHASPEFDLLEITIYPWQAVYTTPEYLGLLNTYSDHLRLPEARRQELFSAITGVLERHGGQIKKPYRAELYLARKIKRKGK